MVDPRRTCAEVQHSVRKLPKNKKIVCNLGAEVGIVNWRIRSVEGVELILSFYFVVSGAFI